MRSLESKRGLPKWGGGRGDYRREERRRKKRTMQVGKTEKGGEKREEGKKRGCKECALNPCLVK